LVSLEIKRLSLRIKLLSSILALNISGAAINGWEKRGYVPLKRVLQIEKDSNGWIRREDLRPEVWIPKTKKDC